MTTVPTPTLRQSGMRLVNRGLERRHGFLRQLRGLDALLGGEAGQEMINQLGDVFAPFT